MPFGVRQQVMTTHVPVAIWGVAIEAIDFE
jgi:hypothetical protein